MIETKEQYEALRQEADQYAAQDGDYSWQNAIKTIEALREVARDAKLALSELERLDHDSFGVELKSAYMILRESVNNFDRRRLNKPPLPDWIKEYD